MTLDKKGIQNAIKFGMSREQIAKQYGLECIDDAIKRIYPHNYIDILRKIDKNTDKRKSAKRQSQEERIKDKLRDAEEIPIEEPEAEKTESEQLEEERNKLEAYIKDTELKLERQTTNLAKFEKAQNEVLEEIAALRIKLKNKCTEYESFTEKAAAAFALSKKTESELNEAMEKLKEIDTKIMSITKISITVNVANEIASETELDFTGYETIFIDLVQSERLMNMSVASVTTLAKTISAVKKIGKEQVEVKFESKKLKELFDTFI